MKTILIILALIIIGAVIAYFSKKEPIYTHGNALLRDELIRLSER